MAKIGPDPVTYKDVVEYVRDYSDFEFELKVLAQLTSAKFTCDHGGVYEDPVTKKSREFDIRAVRTLGCLRARLAVECKNLRANYPLVVHGGKRRAQESYRDILIRRVRESRSPLYKVHNESPDPGDVFREQPDLCVYRKGELVGKHPDQVGRHVDGKTLITGDGEVYDKLSQAIHSSYDLINAALFERDDGFDKASIILPVLVVPDSTIWLVPYEEDGTRKVDPLLVDRISLYVGKTWQVGQVTNYTISHLEIVTYSALIKWLNWLLDDECGWDQVFHTTKYGLQDLRRESRNLI